MFTVLTTQRYNALTLQGIPFNFWDGFPEVEGKRVFIKPNLVSPRQPWDNNSTTRVEVVELVIQKLLEENVGEIVVGECGFKDQWENTMKSTEYENLLRFPKVKIIALQKNENYHKFTLVRQAEGYRSLFGVQFSDYLLECDVVINMPKMKVHSMAIMTGAVKNMMGTMTNKGNMHPRGDEKILQNRLADFYQLTSPLVHFIVMDGIIGSEYAEQCGKARKSGVLLSGTDQWEIDVAACKLMGINPLRVPYLGMIRRDFDNVEVPEDAIQNYELYISFRK